MNHALIEHAASVVQLIRDEGFYKTERPILSPQTSVVRVDDSAGSHEILNLCANNYLGLAGDPRLVKAAVKPSKATDSAWPARTFHLRHFGLAHRLGTTTRGLPK